MNQSIIADSLLASLQTTVARFTDSIVMTLPHSSLHMPTDLSAIAAMAVITSTFGHMTIARDGVGVMG